MGSNGKVDYHIHTDATDGKVSPEKIVERARELKIKTIAFTEHIAVQPDYDWFKFRERIDRLEENGMKILVGVEAKVLDPDGNLNVSRDVMDSADLVLGAVHGYGNVEWLLDSECEIIAHPQIDSSNVEKFLDCEKALELNPQYPMSDEVIRRLVEAKAVFSLGSNTHVMNDLEVGQKYFSRVKKQHRIRKIFSKT